MYVELFCVFDYNIGIVNIQGGQHAVVLLYIIYDLHRAANVSNCVVSMGAAGMCSDVANRQACAGIEWRQFWDWFLGIMCTLLHGHSAGFMFLHEDAMWVVMWSEDSVWWPLGQPTGLVSRKLFVIDDEVNGRWERP